METSQTDHYLPEYVTEALTVLQPRIEATDDGLPKDEAETVLQDHEFEPPAVDVALDRLLQEGYLYEVNGRFRTTLPEQEVSMLRGSS